MAKPELTSTLTIIDKSSNVLEAIGNQADKTSVKIDKLIASLELFGKTDSASGVEKSMRDAGRSLEQFENSMNSITRSTHSVSLSVDSSDVEKQVRSSVNKIKNTISDDFISALERELASSTSRDGDDDFISTVAHDAAMKEIENTFAGIENVFKDMDKKMSEFDKAVVETIDRQKESLINRVSRNGFDKNDLSGIKKKFSALKENLTKPFNSLMQGSYKLQAAFAVITMAISKIAQIAQIADRNASHIARFRMLANAEGLSGDSANRRGEQMRKKTSKIASELGISTSEFNEQIMGFANNAAFKSFEEASKFASILNKSFKAAGTGAMEAESAVRQLLQGLSKGKLQGEDLMSILSSAPQVGALLEQAVARLDGKSIDVYKGKVRELATEGRLTANVIKDAFFGASDQIDKDFKSMPQTFESVVIKFKNVLLESFQPVLQAFSNFVNSEEFKKFMDGISKLAKIVGGIVANITETLLPLVANVFGTIGDALSGKMFKRDVFKQYSSKKTDKTENAIKNQTAIQKLSYQKIYDAQVDQLDAIYEENSILKGMSETQKKYYQTAGRGLGSYRQLQDSFLENIEEEMVKNYFKTNPELANKYGYDKETDSFKKDITWEDYNMVWLKQFEGFKGDKAIQFHSIAELEAAGDKIYDIQQKIETLKELGSSREFEIYKNRLSSDTEWQRKANGMSAESFNDREAQERFDKITAEAMKVTGSKNKNDLVSINLDATINLMLKRVDTLIKAQSVVNEVLATQFAENNKFAEGTERNTRSVHINRDDIEFMKSMTTAEVINRYNTLSSSIVQNNHFSQPPTTSTFGGITARGIQSAANGTRALIGA